MNGKKTCCAFILCVSMLMPVQGLFRIRNVTSDIWFNTAFASQCGSTDDRIPTNDPRVGRLRDTEPDNDWDGLGTAFIILNGALLTAGHVHPGSPNRALEFNVPLSGDCGDLVTPTSPADTYDIDSDTVVEGGATALGAYNDWAVFNCHANSQTGLFPLEAQGAFFRLSYEGVYPSTVRVTGYGQDNNPPISWSDCPLSFYNTDNCTQQTAEGPFRLRTVKPRGVLLEYEVDTEGGCSGSPAIMDPDTAIGIHVFADCTNGYYHGYNWATGFETNADLIDAVNSFTPPNTVYADQGHPSTSPNEDGSVFRPYHRIAEAAQGVPSGGTVAIVFGSYDDTLTISKPMTLVAPFSGVVIGE